jgi:autoinducer 2 (AI-2) kinase
MFSQLPCLGVLWVLNRSAKHRACSGGNAAYKEANEWVFRLSVPAGSYGMICAFSDVMNYINWKHAAPSFMNFELNPEKYHKATFYRAIMENTALVTRGHLRLVEQATGGRPAKIVFAGGASKSALWSQILADVLGIPVAVPAVKEATALGAAILAGKGIGLYPDVREAARSLVQIEREFAPNKANEDVYRRAYENWQAAYAPQRRLSGEGITRYMWSAPGL